MTTNHEAVARRLRDAYSGGAIAPLRDALEPTDADGAYAVQTINTRYWEAQGRRIVGRKAGLTAKAVQAQLGVDQPDFGVLFDDMRIADGGTLDAARALQPKAEAEIAFILGADLPGPATTTDDVAAAVASVHAAIEIVDSRIADWKITFADTVADNGSSAFFVLADSGLPLGGLDLEGTAMEMQVNGVVASTGVGAAALGNPLNAAAWLARTLAARGEPLKAGDILLAGALGPMVALAPGDHVHARIAGIGECSFTYAAGQGAETMAKTKVAIIGSGNIGTDLMIKVMRLSDVLEMGAFVGIDPESDGLKRASRLGVPVTADGIEGLVAMPGFTDIAIVFDATSAGAHHEHSASLIALGKRVIDLTPAAIGPYVIPPVNGDAHLDNANVNMVTCGGQATIPIVAAVNRVAKVYYGEIVASIASKSAGPGTRANIDEFTETTSQAIVEVGGATRGKAIIVLNPAEPPLIMRDTVYCLCEDADREAIAQSVDEMVADVQTYVPGYRLKQEVQFESIGSNAPLRIPEMGGSFTGLKVSVFLEVEGAAHYLPAYAGNLDIMTSAALKTAEKIALRMKQGVAA